MSEADLRDAYDRHAGDFAAVGALLYRGMAQAIVDHFPVSLGGRLVLDFGAGTGATTEALVEASARVVAADLAFEMLRLASVRRPPAVNCDVTALPFRPDAFEAAAGAFVLSHVERPVDALASVARTVRPGGVIVTLGYDGRWRCAAKDVVEAVLARYGYRRPAWYDHMKSVVEPQTAFPERLLGVATTAGLHDVAVDVVDVDVGIDSAPGIAAWRLGLPHYAEHLARLDHATRASLRDDVEGALGPAAERVVPRLLVMSARVR